MNDTISRQAAIDALDCINGVEEVLRSLPSVQPERTEERTETNACDLISRQDAIDALDVLCQEHRYKIPGKRETYSQYSEAWQDALDRAEGTIFNLPSAQPVVTDTNVGDKISKFIDGLEKTFAYIREREGGDSVCGLCEYDGAYIGESGDWCNECPGFDRDDCFKLSDETRKKWTDEIIKALPTVQPEPKEGHWIPHETPDGGVQYECSRCGVLWEFNDGTPEDNEAYFCPKCGKKLIAK